MSQLTWDITDMMKDNTDKVGSKRPPQTETSELEKEVTQKQNH
jgi:hypothetical protein